MHNILLFCLPGLGDTLMFTPVIRILRKKYPDCQIDALTMFPSSRDILANNPFIDTVYMHEFLTKSLADALSCIVSLRKRRYDCSVLAYPAYRREYHLLQYAVGAQKRIAHRFPKGFLSQLHFLNTDTVPVDEHEHNVRNNLRLLEGFGIHWHTIGNDTDIQYDIFLKKDDGDRSFRGNSGSCAEQVFIQHHVADYDNFFPVEIIDDSK